MITDITPELLLDTDENGKAYGYIDGWFINYHLEENSDDPRLLFELEAEQGNGDPMDQTDAYDTVARAIDRAEENLHDPVLQSILETL